MTGSGFTVVDDAHTQMGPILKKMCAQLGSDIREYISILDSVTQLAAKEGHTAERYQQYIGLISGLAERFDSLGNTLSMMCDTYIEDIDDADEFLY